MGGMRGGGGGTRAGVQGDAVQNAGACPGGPGWILPPAPCRSPAPAAQGLLCRAAPSYSCPEAGAMGWRCFAEETLAKIKNAHLKQGWGVCRELGLPGGL